MTLENLVPLINLCKQIPAGHFEDSALVWVLDKELDFVYARELVEVEDPIPAPTLAEIMLALAEKTGYEIPAVYRDRDSSWYVEIKNSTEDRYHNRSHKDNAASAALKLWLDLSVKEKNA